MISTLLTLVLLLSAEPKTFERDGATAPVYPNAAPLPCPDWVTTPPGGAVDDACFHVEGASIAGLAAFYREWLLARDYRELDLSDDTTVIFIPEPNRENSAIQIVLLGCERDAEPSPACTLIVVDN